MNSYKVKEINRHSQAKILYSKLKTYNKMCSYGARKKFDKEGFLRIFNNDDYIGKITK